MHIQITRIRRKQHNTKYFWSKMYMTAQIPKVQHLADCSTILSTIVKQGITCNDVQTLPLFQRLKRRRKSLIEYKTIPISQLLHYSLNFPQFLQSVLAVISKHAGLAEGSCC
jgi:hypothetical protein